MTLRFRNMELGFGERDEYDSLITKNILLRNYQLKLLEKAKKGNSILYLPTGAGKTLIAVHVLVSRSHEIRRPFSEGGKRAFVLATTKVLVLQLFNVLQTHTKFRLAWFTGDMNPDSWNRQKWLTHFENNHVILLTAEILKQIIGMNFIQPSEISVVVFDECHHAVENHPYRLVLESLAVDDPSEGPLLLGLSAVLLNSNPKGGQMWKNIEALENSFKGKVITETQLRELTSFSTRPVEKVVIYKSGAKNQILCDILSVFDEAIGVIDEIVIKSNGAVIPKEGIEYHDKNRARRIRRSFVNLKGHFEEFGLFGGSLSALFHLILFEKNRLLSKDPIEIQTLIYAVTEMNKIRHFAQKELGEEETVDTIIKYSSDKVRQLIQVVKEAKEELNNENLSIIIFVQLRASAVVLAFLFRRLSELDSSFSFIKADFVVGSSVFSKEALLLESSNEETLKQFTSQSLNLLVATNILEEGIDIPDCNVVVSFDFPSLYPSYFQSKGRARNNKSLYYMFISDDEKEKKLIALNNFRQMEKELFQIVSGGSGVRESEETPYKEPDKIQLGEKTTVDGFLAVKAVYRYCAKLPQDRYSLLSPKAWYVNLDNGKKKGFVQLPVNCPLRDVIEGEAKSTQKEANRSAFLVTVKRLYEVGELDDNLEMKSFELKGNYDYLFPNYRKEEVDKSLPQPGTKRRKQMYKAKFAESLSNCLPRPGMKAYLHVLDVNVAFQKPELPRRAAIYEILRCPVTYAILSTRKLDKIFQFPLFLNMGQVNCDFLVNYDEIVLNEAEINDIKSCHFALFKKVTKSVKDAHIFDNRNQEHSFFVVPVEKNEVGRFVLYWDLIRSDFCRNSKSALVRYNPATKRDSHGGGKTPKLSKLPDVASARKSSTSLVPYEAISGRSLWKVDEGETNDGPAFVMTAADYRFFVIVPNYRRLDPPQCYIVDKFCQDMSPLTPFPRAGYENYISYYRDKYEVGITNTKQPLLRVSPLFACSNFNRPREAKKGMKEKNQNFDEHLLPELCDVIPFDRRFWVKAALVPSILNRICHVYCVEEFRKRVVKETGLGTCDLPEGTSWRALKVDRFCADDEVEEGLGGNNLKPALPLSKLKDESKPSPDSLKDPERHLYDYSLCDLEFYVKRLEFIHSIPVEGQWGEENEEISKLMTARNVSVPKLEILSRPKSQMGPDLALLVQACTAKSANDIVNYERLETLGDSFLKFATTFFLFRYHADNEGLLTSVKSKMVGNRNLLYCGTAKNIQDIINVTDFVPVSDWTPPLLTIPETLVEDIVQNNMDSAVLSRFEISCEEQFSGVLSNSTLERNKEILRDLRDEKCYEFPTNSLLPYKVLEDKTVSDCVEALIGAYLYSVGMSGAFDFLVWLGVLPESKSKFSQIMGKCPARVFGPRDDFVILNLLGKVFYSELEDVLNYQFRDKAYLLEALTHPSYCGNGITNCYQRLEFLGDAVLDFIITIYVYENCGDLTPGQITDIRSALVNNVTFACLVVRYDIHKYMLSFSSTLSKAVESFVVFQRNRNHAVTDNVLILEETDCLIGETIQVPKALGDIFESLAGAIFLDSGNSLETVWAVYYRLMKKELDEFTKTVPKTAVRLLQEICGDRPYYETKVVDDVTQVSCSVYYENQEVKAYGFGQNKKEGKRSAAKLVLNKILSLKK